MTDAALVSPVTVIGEAPTMDALYAEIESLRKRVENKSNSRQMFRDQVLREIVTPAFRDQQQHEGKRVTEGPMYDATDTMANTIFQQLGEAIRYVMDNEDYLDVGVGTLDTVYAELETRADKVGKFVWCKACGEIIMDCNCSVKKPRESR